MGLFSRRSAATDAASPPRLREIGDPEREWIAAHVELVTRTGANVDDLDAIRLRYEQMLASWRRINPPERDDPDVMVNAIGTAFGEHLIRTAPLRWMLADDEHGTELAVYEPRRPTLLYPAKLVADRWTTEDPSGDFLTAISGEVAAAYPRGRRGRH